MTQTTQSIARQARRAEREREIIDGAITHAEGALIDIWTHDFVRNENGELEAIAIRAR